MSDREGIWITRERYEEQNRRRGLGIMGFLSVSIAAACGWDGGWQVGLFVAALIGGVWLFVLGIHYLIES